MEIYSLVAAHRLDRTRRPPMDARAEDRYYRELGDPFHGLPPDLGSLTNLLLACLLLGRHPI